MDDLVDIQSEKKERSSSANPENLFSQPLLKINVTILTLILSFLFRRLCDGDLLFDIEFGLTFLPLSTLTQARQRSVKTVKCNNFVTVL